MWPSLLPALALGNGFISRGKFASSGVGVRPRPGEEVPGTRGPVAVSPGAEGRGPAGGVEPAARADGEGGGVGGGPGRCCSGRRRRRGPQRRAARPGRADPLSAALAHSPLRNRQRRGFPRGGHSIQPLHTPRSAAASQNGGAHRGDGGRRRGPILWEARDLSTWKTSAEDASEFGHAAEGTESRGISFDGT